MLAIGKYSGIARRNSQGWLYRGCCCEPSGCLGFDVLVGCDGDQQLLEFADSYPGYPAGAIQVWQTYCIRGLVYDRVYVKDRIYHKLGAELDLDDYDRCVTLTNRRFNRSALLTDESLYSEICRFSLTPYLRESEIDWRCIKREWFLDDYTDEYAERLATPHRMLMKVDYWRLIIGDVNGNDINWYSGDKHAFTIAVRFEVFE